jgi:hypothetical protein
MRFLNRNTRTRGTEDQELPSIFEALVLCMERNERLCATGDELLTWSDGGIGLGASPPNRFTSADAILWPASVLAGRSGGTVDPGAR